MTTLILLVAIGLLGWIVHILRKLSSSLLQQEPTVHYPAISRPELAAAREEVGKSLRRCMEARESRETMDAKYEGKAEGTGPTQEVPNPFDASTKAFDDIMAAAAKSPQQLEAEYYDAIERARRLSLQHEKALARYRFLIEANIRVSNGAATIAQVRDEWGSLDDRLLRDRLEKQKKFMAQFARKPTSR